MTAAAIDTLALARRLRERAHFSAEQAEGVAEALNEMLIDQVATKSDIKDELQHVRDEFQPVKADLLLLKWMMGFTLAFLAAIFSKLFLH